MAHQKLKIDPAFCKHKVWKGWHYYQCSKPNKKDGYCGLHHPDAVKARRDKREAKWAAEDAARIASNARHDAVIRQIPEAAKALYSAAYPFRGNGNIYPALQALEQAFKNAGISLT